MSCFVILKARGPIKIMYLFHGKYKLHDYMVILDNFKEP